jgi:hypothetical protein
MPSTSGNSVARKPPTAIVTPAQGRAGKIASVHPTGHFVVITFPVGVPLPPAERRLKVYRAGLKVAEVKIDPDRRIDVNAVADIVAGECEVGDEVRDE